MTCRCQSPNCTDPKCLEEVDASKRNFLITPGDWEKYQEDKEELDILRAQNASVSEGYELLKVKLTCQQTTIDDLLGMNALLSKKLDDYGDAGPIEERESSLENHARLAHLAHTGPANALATAEKRIRDLSIIADERFVTIRGLKEALKASQEECAKLRANAECVDVPKCEEKIKKAGKWPSTPW